MTEYVVLKQNGADQDTWAVFTRAEGQTAKAAIRKAVNGETGVYVAIPARSFRPVSADVDTKTTVKFSAA